MSLRKFTLPGALFLLLTAVFPATGLAYYLAPKVRCGRSAERGVVCAGWPFALCQWQPGVRGQPCELVGAKCLF